MTRRLAAATCGLATGLTARLVLPGHPTMGLPLTAVLSVVGAVVAGLLTDHLRFEQARYLIAGLGALAMLLAYALVVT
ncbi:MAG: GlsB/YeaQ/YmgE family stress response membrane protein [Acidobacteria bacterium]|nr:GlsB/YeaQ/YmgE family stress response membrane protein [Acidobacteriota bacterium]